MDTISIIGCGPRIGAGCRAAWVFAVAVCGCGASGVSEGTTAAFRGMHTAEIAVVTETGRRIPLSVRVADTDRERAAGFQHVAAAVIAESRILFVFAEPLYTRFHMQNVAAPLDIAFADTAGRITDVLTMQPGSRTYGPSGDIQYALEARAGFFLEQGILEGARLDVPSFHDRE